MIPSLIASLALLLCAGLAQAGTVEVRFDHPERYTDVGPASDLESVQTILAEHLQALGQSKLPAGQTLKITIADIDLAGRINPWMGRLHQVRILGGHVDWPRIELRYTLSDGDRTVAQGSEVVADMAYDMRSNLRHPGERLPYEQRMLTTWFNQRFGAPAPR